jgi:hypothetical protein
MARIEYTPASYDDAGAIEYTEAEATGEPAPLADLLDPPNITQCGECSAFGHDAEHCTVVDVERHPIPPELCGVEGCSRTPHERGVFRDGTVVNGHSWERVPVGKPYPTELCGGYEDDSGPCTFYPHSPRDPHSWER